MTGRGFALLALALAACSVDPGADRAGTVAAGIAIDSVRFLPFGSRFVLRDSASPVAFLGYHAGYLCSRFLLLGLADAPAGDPPAYRPDTRVRLPASDECALDSGGRDTTAAGIFSGGALVRLANPMGVVTDSALPVPGRLGYDSLRGIPDSSGALAAGNVLYRDSAAAGPELRIDSLPACRYLNSADREKRKDTLLVRYSWVDLDPASQADSCRGLPHSDRAAVQAHRALRMGGGAASR
jgi:hypothetical protein